MSYLTPHEYIASGLYGTLIIPSKPELTYPKHGLELAIAGFVASPDTQKENLPGFPSAVPYSTLRELVFEYLKVNDEPKIRYFIKRHLGVLGRIISEPHLDELEIQKARRLREQFIDLERKDVSQIQYSEFMPREFSDLCNRLYNHVPFKIESNKSVMGLVKMNILLRKSTDRGVIVYVRLNPDVQVTARHHD